MIDARTVAALVRPHLPRLVELELIQEGDDHAVFDAGDAIVKCGGRDDPRAEAWACEHARANGVPASRVIAMSSDEPIPYLVVARAEGVPLWDPRLSDELAIVAAREAGALLRRLHELVAPGFGDMQTDGQHGDDTRQERVVVRGRHDRARVGARLPRRAAAHRGGHRRSCARWPRCGPAAAR